MSEIGRLGTMAHEADRHLQELADDTRSAFGAELCLVSVVLPEERRMVAWSGELFDALPSGGEDDPRESPRMVPWEAGISRRVMEGEAPVVVEDFLAAGADRAESLGVRYGIRFYAGAPLVTSGGHVIGAMSILDTRPREFDEGNVAMLSAFARAVVGRLETLGALERERAARESERAYRRNVFDLANDAILIFDPETGRVLDANDRAGATYLMPKERLVGADFAGLSVDPRGERRYVQTVVREGSRREFVSAHRRGDGGTMDVEINSSVVEHRGRRAVLSIVHDVTERRRMERALREGRERFRSLVQNASEVITLIDATGTVGYVSPAIRRMLGYEPGERVGSSALELLHPDDTARARVALAEASLAPGRLLTIEARVRHRDGTWRHLEVVGTNLLEDPAVGAIVLNSRDITARKRAEEALKESERRYAAMLSNTPALVYRGLHVPRRAGLFCSDYARELTGHAPGEFVGGEVALEDVIVREDRGRVRREVREALATGGRYRLEYTIRRKDGASRHVEELGQVVREGDAATTEGVIHDVTELRRAVQGLQEAEVRYRTLVEQIPTATYIEDHRGAKSLRYLSPQYEDLLGYKPEEALRNPDHWLNTLHPEDRERAIAEDLRTDETGEPFEMEYRQFAKDGRAVWIHDHAVLVRDENDHPLFWQGVLADITERRLFLERLEHMALHDPLTNLPNRHLFTERLERALRRSEREGKTMAVLMVDLDDFKGINDSLGHEAGDRVLISVADRLGGCLRPGDTVARLGGDEFTVLLEDVREEIDATRTAERIERTLRNPISLKGRSVVATPSIGVAFSGPSGAGPVSPDDLLRNADTALYEAKERGKDRHVVSRSRADAGAPGGAGFSGELAGAVERGELAVHYQPLASVETGGIVATEALVRWEHPRRGLLSPAEFIPMAEEDGLIAYVGRWVLGVACRQAGEWHARYPASPPLAMSVNLSASQLKDPALIEDVHRALREADLEPGSLILEITESVAMDDTRLTMATLDGLKELGVRLAMDDFGSGYSSLSYLKRFPLDLIKIDRSIVTGLDKDPGDRAIVSATITMAHALNLVAVAEGVNTEREAAELRALGCDLGQGPYWWPPREAASVEKLLAGRTA